VVVSGGPDLGWGSVARKLEVLREKFDWVRTALILEPRGSDVMVGAMLVEPDGSRSESYRPGVIFFNNIGYLGMCGHGTIGVAVTLVHMGRIGIGEHLLETPVGNVKVWVEDRNTVSVENVESYRKVKDVEVMVEGRKMRGDVAWGGNWFFLVEDHGQELRLSNVARLTEFCWKIRKAAAEKGFAEIDHVELFGESSVADAKNFVLCPGGAYDRSPCGTGTSAKLACLVADGKLKPGQIWRQESIIGSMFEGSVRIEDGKIFPRIKGRAYVNGEATIVLDEADPYRFGIRP
jgi:4-hydroxyproline epimerase